MFEFMFPLESGDDEFLAVGVLLLVFFGGLGLMYVGFQRYRVGRIIKNTAPERIRSVALGRTEVHGHVRDAGTTFDAPFTTDECVYRQWKIEEQREYRRRDEDGRTKTERRWVTLDRGSDVAPFYVEDETGQLFVNTNDETTFEISGENTYSQSLGRGRSFPSEVTTFMRTREDWIDPMDVIEASPFADEFSGHRAEILTPDDFDQLDERRQVILKETLPEEYFDADGSLEEPVDAHELGIHLESRYGDEVDHGGFFSRIDTGSGSPPTRIISTLRSVVRELDKLATTGGGSSSRRVRKRRYSQQILPVDDEVYVFGGATERPDAVGLNEDRLVLEEDGMTGRFIVSDRDEEGIVKYYNRRAPLYLLGGLGLSALMLYLILTLFGPF